jgi:two-component system, OmpR family, heavy metal sensor histidine kinase CusS
MKRLSIRLRLTLWYLAIFAVGELIFGIGMWLILRHNLYDLVDRNLESQVEDVRSFLAGQKTASRQELLEEIGETYSVEHAGDYLAIYGDSGERIYVATFFQAHPSVLQNPSTVKRPLYTSARIENHSFRFLVQKIKLNGQTFTVEVGLRADEEVETLRQFQSLLLLFAPALLLIAAGVGYWMSRRALTPVDELVRTAREVSGSNLSSRVQKLETGDELQRLSDTLNQMLDRIEASFQRVTQFTADASHELRTPVSLIRTEAELALRRSRTGDEYQEALRHILLEAERTSTLIEELLSLARAESGRESMQMKPVDLSQMLRGFVDGWQHVAAIRKLQFSAEIEKQPSFVMADETLFRRVIDILLDNAFKYTPSPGSVALRLEFHGENLAILVQDSGVGIPKEEQSKIFERFYRVDKARSRAEGGAGLGLAIAQWIVTQHHGSITVESTPSRGATFRVELPRIAAPVPNPQPA